MSDTLYSLNSIQKIVQDTLKAGTTIASGEELNEVTQKKQIHFNNLSVTSDIVAERNVVTGILGRKGLEPATQHSTMSLNIDNLVSNFLD